MATSVVVGSSAIKHRIARARYWNRVLNKHPKPAQYSPPRNTIFDKLGIKVIRNRLEEV